MGESYKKSAVNLSIDFNLSKLTPKSHFLVPIFGKFPLFFDGWVGGGDFCIFWGGILVLRQIAPESSPNLCRTSSLGFDFSVIIPFFSVGSESETPRCP